MKTGYGTILSECSIGVDTIVWNYCNLYKCRIGKNCKIASYVEIGEGVSIGDNCKIEAFVYIPKGITIGDGVFIGPHVVFTNDLHPSVSDNWTITNTFVRDGASIGANSTILPGVTIGEKALVGAGSIVAEDVPANTICYGQKAINRSRKNVRK